jgi:hypothetical protein
MPLFIVIFLSIYGLANYYILHRSLQALPFLPLPAKIAVWVVFIAGMFSYILSRLVFAKISSVLYDAVLWFGSMWFAVVLYGFMICLVIDILRLLRLLIMAATKYQLSLPAPAGWQVFSVAALLVLGILIYGHWNFRNVKLKEYSLSMHNPQKAGQKLRIFYFSDSHFTSINNGSLLKKIRTLIEQSKPDLILMGGDVVDDTPENLERHQIGLGLQNITAPLGAYTCLGNHEYFNRFDEATRYLQAHGISVLRDSSVNIGDFVTVIGRDDLSGRRQNGERKSIPELMKASGNASLPVILLDHQPFHLEQAEAAGVALQLSGHTHHGQMFPANLITSRIYELSWGYLKKGNTDFYVSSGIGGWGPLVRTASDAEAVIFDITFTN